MIIYLYFIFSLFQVSVPASGVRILVAVGLWYDFEMYVW